MKMKNLGQIVTCSLLFIIGCGVGVWGERLLVQRIPGEQKYYIHLYYGELVANVAIDTALLQRLEQGDIGTVKGVLSSQRAVDMDRINSATNYIWSEDQRKAIANARQ